MDPEVPSSSDKDVCSTAAVCQGRFDAGKFNDGPPEDDDVGVPSGAARLGIITSGNCKLRTMKRRSRAFQPTLSLVWSLTEWASGIDEDDVADTRKNEDCGLLVFLTKKEEPLGVAASKASKGRHDKREGYGRLPCNSVGSSNTSGSPCGQCQWPYFG